MSKSLKQMAYDTIEAHQETIDDLRTQLAKANERVKRLEKILQRYESEQLQPLKLRVEELERFQEEIAYRCFLEGLNTEKPREPNAENETATAISHFNVMVDRHARGVSRSLLEKLRKEQE